MSAQTRNCQFRNSSKMLITVLFYRTSFALTRKYASTYGNKSVYSFYTTDVTEIIPLTESAINVQIVN